VDALGRVARSLRPVERRESPPGSLHTRKECERQADNLIAFERTVARMQRVSCDTIDAFSCLPCTVDPRPEGALLHDNADPRGPKGK